jgi:hypothetical protein
MMTIKEWARHEPYRTQLADSLKAPFMVAALDLLSQTNKPQPAQSADVTALALLHQFQAGWYACLQALQNLPTLDGAHLDKVSKAAKLEEEGAWGHAAYKKLNLPTE